MLPKKFNNEIPRPNKSRESQNSVTIDPLHLIAGYILGHMIRSGLKTSDQVQGPRCSGIACLILKNYGMHQAQADRESAAYMGM
jgi:hypothetical protein